MQITHTLLAFMSASAALVAAAPKKAGGPRSTDVDGIPKKRLVESVVIPRRPTTILNNRRPVPARFRSLEERRLARREEMKKKQHKKQKKPKKHKKHKGKKVDPEESGDDDPDSGDIDESGEDDLTDESGRDDIPDDTNSGDTNSGDTDSSRED